MLELETNWTESILVFVHIYSNICTFQVLSIESSPATKMDSSKSRGMHDNVS